MKTVDVAAALLLVVGGLLAGLFDPVSGLSQAVYALVGFGAIYQAISWRGIQRRWQSAPARA